MVLVLATPARAQVTTYRDEATYLATQGAVVFQAGFEEARRC